MQYCVMAILKYTVLITNSDEITLTTTWGAAAEADAIGELLKRTQLRPAAEADASGEQRLKWMQTGSSS